MIGEAARTNRDHRHPLLLGHRGASKYVPENTLAAFDLALQHGCDGFEFDLRYTGDARCVVCHDAVHKRKRIERRIFADLGLPAGEDVICRYATHAFLDIELKVPGDAGPIVRLLEKFDRSRFVISSFLPDVLSAVFEQNQQLPLGLICENVPQFRRWPSLPIGALMLHRKLAARYAIDELHAAGKTVFVWTVNEQRQMMEFAERGVEGLISDDTRLLVETLGASAPVA